MVRPAGFGFNEVAAETNVFQRRPASGTEPAVHLDALREFNALAAALRAAHLEVIVFEDQPEPHTPDALFPNNWVSFHSDGTLVLYPMCAPSRRLERRADIIDGLKERFGFQVFRILDLTDYEQDGRFLEGTGSLVFDHVNRCAYASISERTDPGLVEELLTHLRYESALFRATDTTGKPIYHTNVVMTIGTGFAVIAAEAIEDSNERKRIVDRIRASGRSLIHIDRSQMRRFAANILEVEAPDGVRIVAMSTVARAALTAPQLEVLESSAKIVASPLPTIESVGGGSARCMLAEIFLPRGAKPGAS
jgi:hypothetical protein